MCQVLLLKKRRIIFLFRTFGKEGSSSISQSLQYFFDSGQSSKVCRGIYEKQTSPRGFLQTFKEIVM